MRAWLRTYWRLGLAGGLCRDETEEQALLGGRLSLGRCRLGRLRFVAGDLVVLGRAGDDWRLDRDGRRAVKLKVTLT